MDILLTAKDENGTGLSDMDIRNEVDTFLFEGRQLVTNWHINTRNYFEGNHLVSNWCYDTKNGTDGGFSVIHALTQRCYPLQI